MPDRFLTVTKLTKTYGNRKAVDDISFSTACGHLIGVLGENGAGKSTLLALLAGALPPDSGDIIVAGRTPEAHPLAYRRALGYLPAPPPLYPDMTIGAYLRFVYDLKEIHAPDRQTHIEQAAAQARVSDITKRLIGNLSSGLKQRTGLAAALLGDPDVLLFDEPTAGLDPRQLTETRTLLTELGKSRVVLLSTHILAEVTAVCSRVLILHKGKLVYDGPVGEPKELEAKFLAVTR